MNATQRLKTETRQKMQQLIDDFAAGKISREQFNTIYERYHSVIALADMAEASRMPDSVMGLTHDLEPTVAVRDQLQGRAVGMVIYHHRSGRILETLGRFEGPRAVLQPEFEALMQQLRQGHRPRRRVRRLDERRWLVYIPGSLTTIVVQFRHEPALNQLRQLVDLQRDFEQANAGLLAAAQVDPNQLGFPFYAFVRNRAL